MLSSAGPERWNCTADFTALHVQIAMDPMRALASLEFVSARGLETSDGGPRLLSNHVRRS